MLLKDKIKGASSYLEQKFTSIPSLAIVLGSGLGGFAGEIKNPLIVPTNDIPYYPVSTVPGHVGQWVIGDLDGIVVLCIQGRVHYYEGYSLEDVTYYVHLLKALGIEKLVVTTACGGLNPDFIPGDLMLITDQINFAFNNPLIGRPENMLGPRFPDMSKPFDAEMIQIAEQVGRAHGHPFRKGVFGWVTGPNYETAAEVRALRTLGVDAVSMSTTPEVIVANQRFMRVLGISLITNLATGLSQSPLTHEEVTAVAARAGARLSTLLHEIIVKIALFDLIKMI
ncbi:purine-nucleoside phosphorylase [candidate division KSB1 bacterium]|nr:purine-nucleoside phosphorylase [candidate division KSB1 bacterium]RQW00237.1 MAG: purine-nucleoside phosphorylase [candidate division KSB1 bacterium]